MTVAVNEWLSSAESGPNSGLATIRYHQEPNLTDAKMFLTTDADRRPQYRQTPERTDGAKMHYLAVLYY